MRRRDLIALLGGAATFWHRSARAERERRLPLVAFLSPRAPERNVEAFRRGLHELGYVEGQNIALEVRSAGGDNGEPSSGSDRVFSSASRRRDRGRCAAANRSRRRPRRPWLPRAD